MIKVLALGAVVALHGNAGGLLSETAGTRKFKSILGLSLGISRFRENVTKLYGYRCEDARPVIHEGFHSHRVQHSRWESVDIDDDGPSRVNIVLGRIVIRKQRSEQRGIMTSRSAGRVCSLVSIPKLSGVSDRRLPDRRCFTSLRRGQSGDASRDESHRAQAPQVWLSIGWQVIVNNHREATDWCDAGTQRHEHEPQEAVSPPHEGEVGRPTEPRRVCWRLQLMSRMEHHEQNNEQIYARSPRTFDADGFEWRRSA